MSSQENLDPNTSHGYLDHTPQETRSQERPRQSSHRRSYKVLRLSHSQFVSGGAEVASLRVIQSCNNNKNGSNGSGSSFWNSHHSSRSVNSFTIGYARYDNIRKNNNGESPILAYKMRQQRLQIKRATNLAAKKTTTTTAAAAAAAAISPAATSLAGSLLPHAGLPSPNVAMVDTTHCSEPITAATAATATPLLTTKPWWEQEEVRSSAEKILAAILGWPVCPCCHMPHSGFSTPNVDMADEATSRSRLVAAAAASIPTPAAQQWQQELQARLNQMGNDNAPTQFCLPVAVTPSSAAAAVITETSSPAAATARLTTENSRLSMRVLALEARVEILYFVLERVVNHLDQRPGAQT
jgi:hypothetical protein